MSELITTLRVSAAWLTARLNVRNERGATAVEYGLMVALIAAVIIGSVVLLGNNAKNAFNCTATAVASKTAAAC